MKKVIAGCLLLAGAATAHADDVRLVPGDSSPLTRMCLAATESEEALKSAIDEAGLSRDELDSVRCNGLPLSRFARQYRDVAYDFKASDRSAETRLCLAAVTSPAAFEAVRAEHFADVSNIEQEISCNGMPLARFISRYGRTPMITAYR